MEKFFSYAAIFRTPMIEGLNEKVVIDPVTIELIDSDFQYFIPLAERVYIEAETMEHIIPPTIPITLRKDPNGVYKYLILTVRIERKLADKYGVLNFDKMLKDEINRIITLFSVIYSPTPFAHKVYEGPIVEQDGCFFLQRNMVSIEGKVLVQELDKQISYINTNIHQSTDIENRLKLMSNFYSRALAKENDEEYFIWLWTVLEVYPMQDTSNIEPLVQKLARITGHSEEVTRKKLRLKRMKRLRNDLVHHGKLEIDIQARAEFFSRLERIVSTVIREMVGIPYDGDLDEYFQDP